MFRDYSCVLLAECMGEPFGYGCQKRSSCGVSLPWLLVPKRNSAVTLLVIGYYLYRVPKNFGP